MDKPATSVKAAGLVGSLALLAAMATFAPVDLGAQQQPEPEEASEQASERQAYAIGVAVPLSGEYAPLGKQVLEAARLAAAEAGARVVSQDTKGTPVGAVAAVQTLAKDDSVVAVLGPIGRRESRAAAQVAQRSSLPLLTLASVDAVNRVGGWIFRLRLTPAEQAAGLADAARASFPNQTRVGVFFPESKYGRQAAVAFARRFESRGGQVSALASYAEDTTDFRKPLDALVGERVQLEPRARAGSRRAGRDGFLRVRRKGSVDFELLFVPDYHQRVARMLPFMPNAGIQTGEGGEGTAVQMLGLSGWQGNSMKMTGAHAAGAVYRDVFAGPSSGGRAEEFARMFEGKTGRAPVDLDAEVFDAAWLAAQLIRRTAAHQRATEAELPAAKLRLFWANQLPRSAPFGGVAGPLSFGTYGEPLRPVQLFQFDVDGTVTPWQKF